jgi:hypothetical protein
MYCGREWKIADVTMGESKCVVCAQIAVFFSQNSMLTCLFCCCALAAEAAFWNGINKDVMTAGGMLIGSDIKKADELPMEMLMRKFHVVKPVCYELCVRFMASLILPSVAYFCWFGNPSLMVGWLVGWLIRASHFTT